MFSMKAFELSTSSYSEFRIVVSGIEQRSCRNPTCFQCGVETRLVNEDKNVVSDRLPETFFTSKYFFEILHILSVEPRRFLFWEMQRVKGNARSTPVFTSSFSFKLSIFRLRSALSHGSRLSQPLRCQRKEEGRKVGKGKRKKEDLAKATDASGKGIANRLCSVKMVSKRNV